MCGFLNGKQDPFLYVAENLSKSAKIFHKRMQEALV